jgi:hypothetical protein
VRNPPGGQGLGGCRGATVTRLCICCYGQAGAVRPKHTLSAAARKKIAAFQKARWAKVKPHIISTYGGDLGLDALHGIT